MTGNLVNILADFLKDRKQKAILNVQHCKQSNKETQSSILEPLLFLIYDIPNDLSSNPRQFVDGTSLFLVFRDTDQ